MIADAEEEYDEDRRDDPGPGAIEGPPDQMTHINLNKQAISSGSGMAGSGEMANTTAIGGKRQLEDDKTANVEADREGEPPQKKAKRFTGCKRAWGLGNAGQQALVPHNGS
jgi:hypothetical protein